MNTEYFALKKSFNIIVSQRLQQSQSVKQHFCLFKIFYNCCYK